MCMCAPWHGRLKPSSPPSTACASSHCPCSCFSPLQVCPASPKYDERTFFFTNPFPTFTQQQQRQRRRQQPATQTQQRQQAGAQEQTPLGQRLARSTLQHTQGTAQPQRPSRLGSSAAEQPGSQGVAEGGGTPASQGETAGDGGSPLPPPPQQQQQQRPPGSTILLRSVLKSTLKGAAPGRGSSQEERHSSQGSEGSGARRVSFVTPDAPAAAAAGMPGAEGLGQQDSPALAQQPPLQAAAETAHGPGVSGRATSHTQLTDPETQRQRQGFVSQITPPSLGLGGGSAGTPLSQAGFKQRRCVSGKGQQLTLLSLELHAESRWVAGRRL